MRIYDSLSGSVKDLLAVSSHHGGGQDDDASRDTSNRKARRRRRRGIACYTCGPTTYGPAHLGHARTYVCIDVLRRCLEHACSLLLGSVPMPLFVMNVTDVDDKILAAAESSGEAPLDLARRYEEEFWRDFDALNCLRPHVVTRVTEHVDSDIVPYIEGIVRAGVTYEIDGDGVYFDVRAFEDRMGGVTRYGKLAPPASSERTFYTRLGDQEECPIDSTKKKRDPRDFVIWKKRKAGERMYWASPWGEGRPGWHIECSAMIEAVSRMFADTHEFAIHAGGVDLKFPHHTNEVAQAEAYHAGEWVAGREWIGTWVHTGHLHIDGLKMSKSLKNFITVEEMLRGVSTDEDDQDVGAESFLSSTADDFRLWCLGLSGPYRGTATYSRERLIEARNVRQKIVRFLVDGEEWLRRAEDGGRHSKKWRDADKELFVRISEASTNCKRALLSNLDGAAFVSEIVEIAALGSAYMRQHSPEHGPSESIRTALGKVRQLLSLVGFSEVTCHAGMHSEATERTSSQVVGGERALLDELVAFRAAVRNVAVAGLGQNDRENTSMNKILELCDDRRDRIFPSLGVELVDGKIHQDEANGSGWKYRLPRNVDGKEDKDGAGSSTSPADLRSIPLEDFFRCGPYEGQFSEFGDDGMPTKHADGSELSNRLLKKLRKKRDKYAKRLEEGTKADGVKICDKPIRFTL